MLSQEKFYLPLMIQKISTKHYSIFFSKLILHDQQLSVDKKNVRHYDYECEGINNLQKFINRKIHKTMLFSIQKLKQQSQQFQYYPKNIRPLQPSRIKQQSRILNTNDHDNSTTQKSKNHLRFNTTMQQSDNSFIFSPNYKTKQKKFKKQICTQSTLTQPTHNNIDRSLILHNLLTKVKQINRKNSDDMIKQQQSLLFLKQNKSNYFNVTLGGKSAKSGKSHQHNPSNYNNTLNNKTSLQTFQNYQNNCCNCSCSNITSNHNNKNTNQINNTNRNYKRQQIIQKIQRIQQKIQSQSIIDNINFTPRQYNHSNVYKPITTINTPKSQYYGEKSKTKNQRLFTQNYDEKPDIIYVIAKEDLQGLSNVKFISNGKINNINNMNSFNNTRSMAHFNHNSMGYKNKIGSYV